MEVYLGLGTNLGEKQHNLLVAIGEIEKRIGHVVRQSAFLETEPWGFDSDNTFVNVVIVVETVLPPLDILLETQAIERDMGREQKSVNGCYHDRVIDIDILLCGDLIIDTPQLTVPHPHMYERQFVMQPLAEVMGTDECRLEKS